MGKVIETIFYQLTIDCKHIKDGNQIKLIAIFLVYLLNFKLYL